VPFPTGRFVDLADYETYAGGATATVAAPIGKLPLFLVAGQLVPLLDPSIDTLAPSADPAVVDPADVADRLDVIVALGADDAAAFVLRDGTRLTARPSCGPATTLDVVPTEDVADCSSCVVRDAPGDVRRVRANSPLARSSSIVVDGVELSVADAPADLRVRWELLLLDDE